MPILGAEMEAGRLVEWRVRPGDRVKRGDIIAVVDTDKAAIDVEVWDEGKVIELLVQPGERVPVGTPLARLDIERPTAAPAGAALGAPVPTPAPVPAGLPARAALPQPGREAPRARRASPAARRLAEQHGLNLESVSGSGPEGAVTLADVEKALAPAPAAPAEDRRASMRRAIAAAMARSKREIPHYYLERAVVMDRALAFLEAENAKRPVTARLLPIVLELKAVAAALADAPELNGHWLDGELRASRAVHAGVAISLRPTGLVAPALHDVQAKSLDVLMKEFTDLVQRARSGSLRSSELGQATITVNGLGDRGADVVYAIVYPPQVALVGFGRIAEAPWSDQGSLASRRVCHISLAADHRASDGHRGSVFLDALDRHLQQPEAL